ncbi:MAG: 4Fe-4S dicluster domain-containing protein, partial [Candidatus Methylomirabilales bacterium]
SRGVDPGVIAYDPEGPWAALLADPVRCNGCGACVQHCPTGAMVEKTEGLQFTLTFSPDRCINCGLCLDACYPAALTYHQDLSLSAVAEGQGDRLVEKQYRHCARCETRFLPTDRTGDDTVCSTCQSWSGGEILGETGTAAAS